MKTLTKKEKAKEQQQSKSVEFSNEFLEGLEENMKSPQQDKKKLKNWRRENKN